MSLEVLHWTSLTSSAVGTPQIRDAEIQRPGTNDVIPAYRSFYAMNMKNMAWVSVEVILGWSNRPTFTTVSISSLNTNTG